MSSKIHHPKHYGGNTTYEAIKVIEAWRLGFCLGNTVKYICRAYLKNDSPEGTIEDLEKARWYLNREIAKLTGSSPPSSPRKSECSVEGEEDGQD